MTNLKRLGLISFVALFLFLFAGETVAQQAQPLDPWQFPELVNSKRFQRWWWAFHQRAYPLEDIPTGAKLRALQEIEQFKAGLPSPSQLLLAPMWVNIGPAPILGGQTDPPSPVSGRVADIEGNG